MTPVAKDLDGECMVLTRYLCGADADAGVVRSYRDAHHTLHSLQAGNPREDALVHLAVNYPTLTRCADAYARHWQPHGALRKKLVLILAILETSKRSHRVIEAVPAATWFGATVALAVSAVSAAVALCGAALVISPLLSLRRRQP